MWTWNEVGNSAGSAASLFGMGWEGDVSCLLLGFVHYLLHTLA